MRILTDPGSARWTVTPRLAAALGRGKLSAGGWPPLGPFSRISKDEVRSRGENSGGIASQSTPCVKKFSTVSLSYSKEGPARLWTCFQEVTLFRPGHLGGEEPGGGGKRPRGRDRGGGYAAPLSTIRIAGVVRPGGEEGGVAGPTGDSPSRGCASSPDGGAPHRWLSSARSISAALRRASALVGSMARTRRYSRRARS